ADALPRGAVFVDLVRYAAGKDGRPAPRYAAFVLRPGQAPARVELGEAGPIEEAWVAWRRAITAGRPDRDAAEKFGRLAWAPLRKQLGDGVRMVYLAPEGMLAQVPWAALPGSKQ